MKVKNKFKLNKSKELKKTLDKMPAHIGNQSIKYFKTSFRKKGFDGHRWKARKEEGRGSIMMVSGALKRSIRRTHLSRRKVVVEAGDAKVAYAKIHNQGGTINQHTTPKQRAFFRARGKKSKGNTADKWKAMSLASELNITIPKRQFMGRSQYLNRKINKMIIKKLNKVF